MCMPLHLANEGKSLEVINVDGVSPVRIRLTELGFIPGTRICVLSKNQECILVKIKDSRIMLNHLMACRVNAQ